MGDLWEKSAALVNGERQADYGDPCDTWKRIAKVFSGILGIEVTPAQAALCMVGVKVVRESKGHKEDNLVDSLGYLRIAGRLQTQEDLCESPSSETPSS